MRGGARDVLARIEASLAPVARGLPGVRIHGIPELSRLLSVEGRIGRLAARLMPGEVRPVRALLFDKSPDTNWALGWHQDRVIAVQARREVPGFGPWTVKRGMQHVAPPFDLLSRMLTLRVHLDPVPNDNAPLLIAPGSHRALVREDAIDAVVSASGTVACLADAGDVWVYATPILHASDAARTPARRRVLQIDYAREDLPAGLAWLGV
ncbi:MAG: phytanoyl-CoA dioxygenase [Sphingomonadales bacterium]|nr:MAG: phytanoyl-CoA dioxygenase [Sphingomonadales bacterium]